MTDRAPILQLMRALDGVGKQTIIRLLLAYPGMDLKVPKKLHADHPLARVIGFEAASKLSRLAGGARFYVPSAFAREQRNNYMSAAYRAGDTVDEIARRHGLTSRHVERILTRPSNPSGEVTSPLPED